MESYGINERWKPCEGISGIKMNNAIYRERKKMIEYGIQDK